MKRLSKNTKKRKGAAVFYIKLKKLNSALVSLLVLFLISYFYLTISSVYYTALRKDLQVKISQVKSANSALEEKLSSSIELDVETLAAEKGLVKISEVSYLNTETLLGRAGF